MVIIIRELSLLYCNFINTKCYLLVRQETSLFNLKFSQSTLGPKIEKCFRYNYFNSYANFNVNYDVTLRVSSVGDTICGLILLKWYFH